MPHKVLCAFPPEMLEKIDYIAKEECRSRSDLIREALRRYIDIFKRKEVSSSYPLIVKPEDL